MLDGKGGADIMMGFGGDDSYYVDNYGDVVSENVNNGTDTVYSSLASYALTANVENLTLIGSASSQGQRQRPGQYHHRQLRQQPAQRQ
ncbi:MAG: hypothetical protein WDN06_04975 [Asticcacaulis sp.]